jgi:sec-independent protein translocase protein TatB
MFNIGGGELLVIVLLALIVLGPQRMPDAMRSVGRVVGQIRRISSGFQDELRDAFDDSDVTEPARTPRRPEAVPLAAAVAAADGADDGAGDDEAGGDEAGGEADPHSEAPSARGSADESPHDGAETTSVAPVIAEALDAITPVERVDPADVVAPTDGAGDAAHSSGDEPSLGDERAAS